MKIDRLLAITGIITAIGSIYYLYEEEKKNTKLKEKNNKMSSFYEALVAWVSLKQQGKTLIDYFVERGMSNIAVYGMKELGELLVQELKDSSVKVGYLIDSKPETVYSSIKVVTPESDLDSVDAIVVTAIASFEEIEKNLLNKVSCPVISLSELIYGVK